jgi:TonB family protein
MVGADTPQLVAPKRLKQPMPMYTAEAARHGVKGTVDVDVVVAPDGSVVRARVRRSLDAADDLDRAALAAAMHWTFAPATVDGRPVATIAPITLTFTPYRRP